LSEVRVKILRRFTIPGALLLLPILLIAGLSAAGEKKKDSSKDACSQANPASLCNAGNTCGSASAPCTVNLKRTSYSSSATPSIPNAKGNDLFCIKAGTTVTWQSTAKHTGFLIDLGTSSPFDPPGALTGGSEKSVHAVAKTPGCFKYNFSASNSRAIDGMSKAAQAELIVIGDQ
jgi:hypothetical protein